MKCSAFKRKASRAKQQSDITRYRKQRNFVVKLNREAKLQFFDNLETSKNTKPYFGINVDLSFFINMLTMILR